MLKYVIFLNLKSCGYISLLLTKLGFPLHFNSSELGHISQLILYYYLHYSVYQHPNLILNG